MSLCFDGGFCRPGLQKRSGGTAQPGDVIYGKTFTSDQGVQTGTMGLVTPGNNSRIYADYVGAFSDSNGTIEAKAVIMTHVKGIIRASFVLRGGFNSYYGTLTTGYAQLYVNGVARGTQRSTSDTATYTEDISVNIGDRVSIYLWGGYNGTYANGTDYTAYVGISSFLISANEEMLVTKVI